MENTKKCPLNLDGFRHYCPDDVSQHESKETMVRHLEVKARIGITPLSQEQSELLQFLRTGQRSKERTIKINLESVRASDPETTEQTITFDRREAMDAIAQLRAGVPFTRSYPQTEIREPEPQKPTMSFEERLIHDWKNDPVLQKEFTSFNDYAAYMRGVREGRIKTHGVGKIIR
ncbi:MAG: hypothetical protein UZ01_02260 [Candidatus Brocadia sinica]|nr:MAG: hypothetical protein UZ01_02260 [Candidatus Brocadia sinica]